MKPLPALSSVAIIMLAGLAGRPAAGQDTLAVAGPDTLSGTPVRPAELIHAQVRMWAQGVPLQVRGTVLRADSLRLVVEPTDGGEPLVAPLTSLQRVQIFEGTGDRTVGTLLGGWIGAVAGYLFVYYALEGPGGDMRSEGAIIYGVPPGAIAGALIGALSAGERWLDVRVVP